MSAALTESRLSDSNASETVLGRVTRWCAAHPIWTVALLAIAVGGANLVWTASHRAPGGLDVDEVTYLTQAFKWHRMIDPAHPFAVPASVLDQDKGPVLPLVSVVALLLGPNTMVTAFAASVVAHGVTAVAVAGIGHRLGGSAVALLSGVVVLVLPAATVSARSYQLAPMVCATLALAVWALLSSDRGRRWVPTLGFGVSVGLLLLSRTMSLAFVPGLAVAAAVHLDRSRVALRNVVLGAGAAVALAGPWWWEQRRSIADYLLGHGYGAAAEGYGPTGIGNRVAGRWVNILGGAGPAFVLMAVVVCLWAAFVLLRRRPAPGVALRSSQTVVWITVVSGMAALLSTANAGMYFELPLLTLAVPGVVALGARYLPLPVRRNAPWLVGLVAVVALTASFLDHGGRHRSGMSSAASVVAFAGLAEYQFSTMQAEPRLGSGDRDLRRAAMAEWWEASRRVMQEVEAVGPQRPGIITVCGSGPQISTGTLDLAGEMDDRLEDSISQWLSTSAPEEDLRASLTPTAGELDRTVVIISARSEPFPGETSVDRCAATARRMGWTRTSRVGLPDGGTVDVLVQRAS